MVSALTEGISSESGNSAVIFDVDIPVSDSTTLTYKLYPEDKLGQEAFVELMATDGSQFVGDTDSSKLKNNEWNTLTFIIGRWGKGKTVCKITVGYQKTSSSQTS